MVLFHKWWGPEEHWRVRIVSARTTVYWHVSVWYYDSTEIIGLAWPVWGDIRMYKPTNLYSHCRNHRVTLYSASYHVKSDRGRTNWHSFLMLPRRGRHIGSTIPCHNTICSTTDSNVILSVVSEPTMPQTYRMWDNTNPKCLKLIACEIILTKKMPQTYRMRDYPNLKSPKITLFYRAK